MVTDKCEPSRIQTNAILINISKGLDNKIKSPLTTEFLSFSGKGSFTSDRGSSGFLSSELGKNFDCTKELKKAKKEPIEKKALLLF